MHLALEGGIRKVLFDFTKVEFIDSLGVGQIVKSHRLVTDVGGKLILCGLQARVLTVLRMANLLQVLDIREKSISDLTWDTPRSDTA